MDKPQIVRMYMNKAGMIVVECQQVAMRAAIVAGTESVLCQDWLFCSRCRLTWYCGLGNTQGCEYPAGIVVLHHGEIQVLLIELSVFN